MKASAQGVELSKAELGCLLAFVGEDDLDVVILTVSQRGMPTLEAYATDGSAAVSGESGEVSDDAVEGQWSISAGFLREVKKVVPKACLLKLEGQCLTEAVLLQEVVDGRLAPSGSYTSEQNEVLGQLGMSFGDSLRPHCQYRAAGGAVAPVVRIQSCHLAAMKHLASAAEDNAVEVMPGERADGIVRFVARKGETGWIAAVTPLAREEEFQMEGDSRQVVAGFVDSMAGHGVTIMSLNGAEVDLTKRIRKPSKKNAEAAQ